MSNLQLKKNSMRGKGTRNYGSYTGQEKVVDRNDPWGNPDIEPTRQKLQIIYFKCIARTKEN